jgi:hypothetical protein
MPQLQLRSITDGKNTRAVLGAAVSWELQLCSQESCEECTLFSVPGTVCGEGEKKTFFCLNFYSDEQESIQSNIFCFASRDGDRQIDK